MECKSIKNGADYVTGNSWKVMMQNHKKKSR